QCGLSGGCRTGSALPAQQLGVAEPDDRVGLHQQLGWEESERAALQAGAGGQLVGGGRRTSSPWERRPLGTLSLPGTSSTSSMGGAARGASDELVLAPPGIKPCLR